MMVTRSAGLRRVKGHGSRVTLEGRLPFFKQSWHLKFRPFGDRYILKEEAVRINWAKNYLPVTDRAYFVSTPFLSLLITKTLPGMPAHKSIDHASPEEIISKLIKAMDVFRNTPTENFSFSAPTWAVSKDVNLKAIAQLETMRQCGKTLHPDFNGLSNESLKKIISDGPDEPDNLVITHGDLCMPNLLFSEDKETVRIVDLGALHLNDPVLDVALLSWCVKANMGCKWSSHFLKQYGLEEEDPRIQYYRLAYDLSLNFPNAWDWVESPKLILQRKRLEA